MWCVQEGMICEYVWTVRRKASYSPIFKERRRTCKKATKLSCSLKSFYGPSSPNKLSFLSLSEGHIMLAVPRRPFIQCCHTNCAHTFHFSSSLTTPRLHSNRHRIPSQSPVSPNLGKFFPRHVHSCAFSARPAAGATSSSR